MKVLASAGDTDPGKEGFREDSQVGVGGIQHAFAHPNGWAGGLFALRVTRRGHFMLTGHDPLAAAVVSVGNSAKFGSFHLEMFGFVFARGK